MEYLGPLDGEIQFSGTTGRSATNNNPVNLKYRHGSYQDKYGAELEPVSKSGQRKFAKFPTMEMGYQAGIEQIQRRQKEGHTLASFVNQFAPPNENPTQEIIAQYSKALGVNPDTPLSDIPAEKVIIPMLARESGTKIVGKGGGVLKAVGNFLGPSSAEAATTGGGLKYLGPLEDEEPTGGQPKYLGPEPAGEAEIEPSEPPPFAGVTSLADNLALYIDPAADKDDLFTNSYADMLNNYTKGKLQNHSDAIENFVNGNTEKFDPFSQYSEQFTGSKYLPTINGLRSSANTLALGKGSLSLAPTLNTMLSKTIGDDSSYNIISRFERREDLPDIINTLFPIEGVVAGTALKLATSLALADTLNLKESEIDFNVVHKAIKKGGLDKKELATKTYEVLKDMYYVNRVPSMKQELTDRGKLNPLAEKLGRVSADEIEQTMIELSGGKAPDAVQKSLETAIKAGAPEVALAKDKLPDIRLAFKGLKAGFMGLVITAATGFDPVSAMTGMGVWPGEDNPVWDAPLNRKERRQLATETVLEAFFPDGIPKPKGMDELILFSAAEAIPAVLPLVIMSSAVGTIPAFATMGLLEDDPVKGALTGAALGTALKAMHFLGKSIQDQVLTWAYRMAGGASIGGGAAALEGGDAKAIGRGALVFTMFEAAGLPKLKLERLGLSEAEIKAFRDAVESQRVSQEAFDVAAKIPDIGTGERQPPTSVEPVKAEKPMSEEQARKAADEKYPKPKWVEIKKRFDAQTKDMEGKPLPEFKLFWEISHDMEVERRAEIILQDAARPRVEAATEATEALPTEAKAKEVEAFALDQKAAPAGAEAATAPRVYQDADGWWRVEGTEVKTSSQAVAEKAASQVKTLAPTIAPEPKVQQAAAGGVGPSGEAAPETIGGVRMKTSELPKSVFQQTLSEYLKNKKAVSQREIEIATKTHAKEVEYAISQGKPVPPEVLADYPDLAKQAGARPAVAKKAIGTEPFEQYLERRKQFRQDVFNKAQDYLATGDGLWIGSYEKAINVINPDAIRTKNGEIQFYAGKKGGKYGGVEKWLPVPDNVLDNWAKEMGMKEFEQFKAQANAQEAGRGGKAFPAAKQTQEEWVALQRPQKTRKPPTYDIQTAVAEGDIITLVRAHGRFDSQSSVIKDVTDPEERKYLLPFVVSKKRNPSVVSVDVFFEDIKNSYPGFFDEFESSADFVRFLVDKSAGRKLKFKSLEEEIAAHDAEIEERAAREGITPEALLGIEDTLEAEIAAAERAGRTERGAETLDLRDEWWTGEPFPEPGIALTGGKPKPSSITLRLDAIEADYPGIDRKKASVVLRTFPDAGDSQIVNMAADETMFRQVAKGSMTAYDKAQLLKKAGAVEVQQELPGTEGKEFDHLRGEAPAGAKPGGTKMYSGGPDTGPFVAKAVKIVLSKKPMAPRVATTPGAKAVEEMFDRSDAVSHAAKRTTWSKFASKLITMTWDVSGNIKRALWKEAGKEFGDEGKRVEMAMVAALGANTRSAQRQKVLKDTVYAGLDLDRSALLNHVITAKGAVIDPTLRHPDLVSPEKIPIEHYREFLADVAKSDPEVMRRADKFFDLMRENLTEGYEAGLITKKVYDDLSQYDYAMRRFEQYMGPYGTYGFSQKLSAGDPGFKALGKGSERLLETDVRLNAARALTTMQARIMDNQAAQAAWAMAKKYPDNSIFKIAKRIKVDPNEVSFSWEDAPPEYDMTAEPKKVVYKYEKLSPGEEYVKVRFDGKEKRLIVSAKYAGEWIKRDPAIRSAEAEIMGWLSGAKLLRATATGYNPSFAARNMPRDISHNWMVTQEYSLNPVKAAKQFAEDYKAVWHDAVHQTGAWVDFVNEGGGMEWLVAQGRIRNKYSGQLEGVQKYAGWVGQFSEIATRLAVRHRALLNGRTSAEATYIARTALDFGQGGSLVKTLDIGLPYLNAGVQATRTLFRAFTEAPGQTAVKLPVWAGTVVAHKMATIGLISAGLYIANNYWNKEAYDQVPAEVQENSWVVTTPLSYIDKNGDKRFIYFPIAKDQTQRLVTTLFEATAAKMMGHDYNWDKVKLAAEDLSIYIPWEKMPPTMAAFIGYATNKDFWRNRDIWRGPNVDPKEEFTPYTHPLAVKFGQATGLSPARMTYFFEQYIASSNLFSGLVGAGLRKIMETVPERDREKSMAELITGIPGLNTLVKSTDPMAQFRKPIADYQAASTTKSYKQWRDFDTRLEAYYAKPTREKLEKLIAFKNSQPEEDHDKLNRHYKEYGAYRTIPNSRFWMELKHASPEARANGFLYRFKTATPDEQRKLWNQAKELPGIVTERFVDELKKAQEGATQ